MPLQTSVKTSNTFTSTQKKHSFRFLSLSVVMLILILSIKNSHPTTDSSNPSYTVIINNHRPVNLSYVILASASKQNFKKQIFQISASLSKSDSRRHALFLFSLLTISMNVELNPGPTFRYPCGTCCRPSKKNKQSATLCDNCNTWYHKKCLDMNSKVFEALANSSCSWICCQCGLPNFSSCLFDTPLSPNKTNRFDPLQNLQDHIPPDHLNSPFRPPRASSPKKPSTIKDKSKSPASKLKTKSVIKNLLINFRSCIGKKTLLPFFT